MKTQESVIKGINKEYSRYVLLSAPTTTTQLKMQPLKKKQA